MAKQEKKRKRGRPPKQKFFSPAELKKQAEEDMRKSQARLGTLDYEKTEDGLETMLDESRLKKCTQAELKELRRMAERLWDRFQVDKEYEEDQAWEGGYGVNRNPLDGLMSEEAWEKEHEFLKKKRKNAKKIHNIYTLPEHKREAKGLAADPVQTEFDIDATEAEIEQRLMEQARIEQQKEQMFPKGRRVSGRPKADPNAPKKKSFWI